MNSPPPDFLNWAFWIKDSASMRDLLISIVAIIGIPFLIWRDFSTHRIAKAAVQQADTAAERHGMQTQADQDRRITDSFIKAVELLGSDKLEARLGAIYALERVARESKRDHWSVMQTLTAYVRDKSPMPHFDEQDRRLYEDDDLYLSIKSDVQAVLTVLAERELIYETEMQHIDLHSTNLSAAILPGVHLEGAKLSSVSLE